MKKSIRLRLALLAAASLALTNLSFAADAAANWKAKCAACHAPDGKGKKALATKDYTAADVQAALTDAAATKAINDGLTEGTHKMPAFKDKLTPDEVKALVAYMRTLKK